MVAGTLSIQRPPESVSNLYASQQQLYTRNLSASKVSSRDLFAASQSMHGPLAMSSTDILRQLESQNQLDELLMDDQHLETIAEGGYFGEQAIFKGHYNKKTKIRCLVDCHFAVLSK